MGIRGCRFKHIYARRSYGEIDKNKHNYKSKRKVGCKVQLYIDVYTYWCCFLVLSVMGDGLKNLYTRRGYDELDRIKLIIKVKEM